MSSTVTTATVSTVTAAATFSELSQVLTLVAILTLIGALMARELGWAARGDVGRRFLRGVDIALLPLTVSFGLVIALGSALFH